LVEVNESGGAAGAELLHEYLEADRGFTHARRSAQPQDRPGGAGAHPGGRQRRRREEV